jgi:hypothetical protein
MSAPFPFYGGCTPSIAGCGFGSRDTTSATQDTAIGSIQQKVPAGIQVSSLDPGGNHIDPDPVSARRISTPCG